jgi:hypothetical protein
MLYSLLSWIPLVHATSDPAIQEIGTGVVTTFVDNVTAFLSTNYPAIIGVAATIFILLLAVRLVKKMFGGR